MNEIYINENGLFTISGTLAHELWREGGYPTTRCSDNKYYVYEHNELPQGYRWELVGWSTNFVKPENSQVLINLKDVPYERHK